MAVAYRSSLEGNAQFALGSAAASRSATAGVRPYHASHTCTARGAAGDRAHGRGQGRLNALEEPLRPPEASGHENGEGDRVHDDVGPPPPPWCVSGVLPSFRRRLCSDLHDRRAAEAAAEAGRQPAWCSSRGAVGAVAVIPGREQMGRRVPRTRADVSRQGGGGGAGITRPPREIDCASCTCRSAGRSEWLGKVPTSPTREGLEVAGAVEKQHWAARSRSKCRRSALVQPESAASCGCCARRALSGTWHGRRAPRPRREGGSDSAYGRRSRLQHVVVGTA